MTHNDASARGRRPDDACPGEPHTPRVASGRPAIADTGEALKPKDVKECANCPEMTVVPAGSFTMGSPTSEPGHSAEEAPQHTVTIARQFAVGRFEVTFDEWDACAADGGCNSYKPSDEGWGRDRLTAINVSWNDAKAYAGWLSKKTGKSYRLLSGAEYEYATRAGTQTAYPWGVPSARKMPTATPVAANGTPSKPRRSARLPLTGSVFTTWWAMSGEWTEDCYHDTYSGAPADGSAWVEGANCFRRVVRGGSFCLLLPSSARRAATGSPPTTGSTTLVSGSLERLHLKSVPLPSVYSIVSDKSAQARKRSVAMHFGRYGTTRTSSDLGSYAAIGRQADIKPA